MGPQTTRHGMKVLLFISPVPGLRKNMHDDQRLPGAVGAKWVLVGSPRSQGVCLGAICVLHPPLRPRKCPVAPLDNKV